jgi:hypothetical protein
VHGTYSCYLLEIRQQVEVDDELHSSLYFYCYHHHHHPVYNGVYSSPCNMCVDGYNLLNASMQAPNTVQLPLYCPGTEAATITQVAHFIPLLFLGRFDIAFLNPVTSSLSVPITLCLSFSRVVIARF